MVRNDVHRVSGYIVIELFCAKGSGLPNRVGFLSRQTFVIGADGNLKKIYREVDVSKHASEVLTDVGS